MRLFLALDLPAEVRRTLRRTGASLRDRLAGWRWLNVDGIHLTVRFLGEVREADLPGQLDAWREAARDHGPLSLRLRGCGVFPTARRPRVLWVGVEDRSGDERLAGLAQSVERCCRDLGFEAEGRRFRPHLTLARVRRGETARAPADDFEVPEVSFRCDELVLFRSVLTPTGARYTRLESFPLAG